MKKIFNIVSSKISKLINKNLKTYHFKKDGFISRRKIKKFKNLNIFFIKKGKIFTNSNEDAAYLKDNYVLVDPSYQYRNSKNSNIKKNFIFKNGINRFKKKFNGKIISIISGGAAKTNYGHWLFDSISRLLIILKNKSTNNFDYLYVPSFKYKYQKEIFKYLNISTKKVISSEKNKYIEGDEIICTNHPFEHRFDKISKSIIRVIRNTFLKFGSKSNIKCYKKIYIERDYSKFNLKGDLSKYKDNRILINNDEIKNYLKKKGFKSYKFNSLTFADQIKIFSNAKIIISMFGAELSNLVFCNKGTKVIEIKNKKELNEFKNISKLCRLKHTQISIKPLYKSIPFQNGILKCNLAKLKNLLRSNQKR